MTHSEEMPKKTKRDNWLEFAQRCIDITEKNIVNDRKRIKLLKKEKKRFTPDLRKGIDEQIASSEKIITLAEDEIKHYRNIIRLCS